MRQMFQGATSFNIDLSSWDVTKAGNGNISMDMVAMFTGATSYNHTLCGHAWLESKAASTSAELLLFTGTECRKGDTSSNEVVLQAGGATLQQCTELCRQHVTCQVFLWWPSGTHSGRCLAETGVIGADDCNPVTNGGINTYQVNFKFN